MPENGHFQIKEQYDLDNMEVFAHATVEVATDSQSHVQVIFQSAGRCLRIPFDAAGAAALGTLLLQGAQLAAGKGATAH